MTRTARVAALSALALSAALLAGCGGGGDDDKAAEELQDVLSTLVNGGNAPILACTDLDTPVKGAPAAVAKGKALPDLSLRCLGGGDPVTLSDLRGPLVLNVWASWCLPCADEIPYLSAAHQALGDKVRFAGVALTDQDPDSKAWLSFHGVDWPSLADPKGAVRGPLRIPGPPVTLFVNSAGTIAEVHYGAFTSARQVQDAIVEHLGVA